MLSKEIASAKLKPGVNYLMKHTRKGEALVKCVEGTVDGGTFIVMEGELRGIHDHYGPGDEFMTCNDLAKFFVSKPTTAKNVKQRVTKAVPMAKFGQDHWSTFAYIETRSVDHGGEPGILHMRCDKDRHPQFAHAGSETKHPTRLKKGELRNHDDWDCLDDLELLGFIENEGTALHRIYKLTDLGSQIAAQLRKHKADKGNFSNFAPKR